MIEEAGVEVFDNVNERSNKQRMFIGHCKSGCA